MNQITDIPPLPQDSLATRRKRRFEAVDEDKAAALYDKATRGVKPQFRVLVGCATVMAAIAGGKLARMRPEPVADDEPKVIRLADRRAQIRRDRVYESTAGPPPDKRQRRLCQEAPADAQRAMSLSANNDSHRICPDASALPAPSDPCAFSYPRLIERFHRLGPRPLYEFLLELGAERTIAQLIEHKLRRYVERLERIDPAVLAAIGADKLPPFPIHSVNLEQGDSP